ncbi:MAG TPA: hypothetical protein VFK89_09070 [Actinomycetota bacterium]|nr:hypothetical protein [Actinomycetota bacterium]
MRKTPWSVVLLVALIAVLASPSGALASFGGTDGKIVFSRSGDGAGIYVMNRGGGGLLRIARGNSSGPSWSPDGSQIAFVRWHRDGSTRLKVMDAVGSNAHPVGTSSQGMTQGCALQSPMWSYDGLYLLYRDDCFDQRPRVAQLRIVSADGTGSLDLTDYANANFYSVQPWSPDLENGSEIVFSGNRGTDQALYLMNSDGSDVRLLVDGTGDDFAAVWSPAGTTIAYSEQTIDDAGDPTNSLWTVSPPGSPDLLLEGSPHITEPQWSPDGSMLLFNRRDYYGTPTASILDLATMDETSLSPGFDASVATWAPAGTAILFSKGGNIVRYRLSDGAIRKLTTGSAYDGAPDWQARQP